MANTNNTGNAPKKVGRPSKTVAEIRAMAELDKERQMENFAKAKDALKQLRDPNRNSTNIITAYDREAIRGYLQSPATNEQNLRDATKYLFYRSQVFSRVVYFYSSMFCLNARRVIPNYSLTKSINEQKVLKQYQNTLDQLEKYDLQNCLFPVILNAFLYDAVFAIFYRDDTGSFAYILDPSYCRIDGVYLGTGWQISYSVDMSKYRSSTQQELIEWLGEPLQSMYRAYESTGERFQHMPEEYSLCLKFRIDDLNTIIPPFAPILQQLAGLNDLADIQAIADEASIFKLLLIPMRVINGSKQTDDWAISPQTIIDYYVELMKKLPQYIAAAPIPGDVDADNILDFSTTSSDKDIDRYEQSQSTILSTAGGGAVLNAGHITSTAAFNAWLKAETEYAISPLLPQIEGFTNRMLRCDVNNPCKVKYFECSIYTQEDMRKSVLESCQYGFSNRLAYNTLLGISEKETLAMQFLEEGVLDLPSKMKYPLSSSYTTSNNEGGRPQIDDDELSDSGERSRNK